MSQFSRQFAISIAMAVNAWLIVLFGCCSHVTLYPTK
jgi:hypothetical protein